MNTPIYDFLLKYAASDTVRLHMPGAKGNILDNRISELFPLDITEIKGADSLFEASGIIAESEKNAAELFSAGTTLFSCQGSTLGIQTMLSLVTSENKRIAAVRNCHKAMVNAAALLGLTVDWIFPQYHGSILSGDVLLSDIENALKKNPAGLYITSPDYLGKIQDISAISRLCKKYRVPLLVDNAHGAYLAFLEENMHPLALGADICCDSAHKTLPALTGAGYLHIKKECTTAKDIMSLFASTSPSYLIMASLDLCNKYIEENIRSDLKIAVERMKELKSVLSKMWEIEDTEPMKLTIKTISSGLYGYELADILRESGIECEYADETHIVLMFSPLSRGSDFSRTRDALLSVKQPKILINEPSPDFPVPVKAMEIREATLAPQEEIPVDEAVGRICGRTKITCPPGVALIVSGEIIDEKIINILKRYSILHINVIK